MGKNDKETYLISTFDLHIWVHTHTNTTYSIHTYIHMQHTHIHGHRHIQHTTYNTHTTYINTYNIYTHRLTGSQTQGYKTHTHTFLKAVPTTQYSPHLHPT